MTNYVQIKICEIEDPDFRSLIVELCQGLNWEFDEFYDSRLSDLLMSIGKEDKGKSLTRQHLPLSRVLTTRVDKLPFDSVVHQACRELARMKGSPIEAFDGKTVLTLIKSCYKVFCPKPYSKKRGSL